MAASRPTNEKPPEGGFGNDFGNKALVLGQTLVIPIN
jgi:hypothetical protein